MLAQGLFVDAYHAGNHVLGRADRRVKLHEFALRIAWRVLFATTGFFRHSIHALNIARVIMVGKVGNLVGVCRGYELYFQIVSCVMYLKRA